jgi:GTPase Era involved in 16S rRNA processing
LQGKLLYEKVEQVLMESDAVLCVVNGKQLKNQAQQTVCDMINKMARFNMQNNIMVMINHMDRAPTDQLGKDQEQQMRVSTATSFLGDGQKTDLVYPTSGESLSLL